uniref:Large ribosomal subunit protein bL9c n=1 Tax=Caloglossa intermedia TaxID=100879 RepID=A0A1Z1M617_9FLOR|nr:ribosomal protein L9 [Caloglossa intermedia]ARW61537.1 ribosomal protein L9 [Caloglossa intermedia]
MSKKIKIILKKDCKNIGQKNNIAYVAKGYAINYLIPNQIAIFATKKTIQHFKKIELIEKHKIEENKKKIKELTIEINNIQKIIIFKKIGESQYIFGSVTDKDIIQKIVDYTGIQLDKKYIQIQNIKTIGRFSLEINLQYEGFCKIQVHILPVNI